MAKERWVPIVEDDRGKLFPLKRTYPSERKAWEAAQRKDREMHGEFWPAKEAATRAAERAKSGRSSGFSYYRPEPQFKVRSIGVAKLRRGQTVGVLEL